MICFFINDVKLTTVKYILDSSDEINEISKIDFKRFDYIKYEIFKGYEDIISQRQYYLSFDLDLRRIKVKNDFLRTVLHTISFIKFPAPALEFNQKNGGTKLYWLYF